MQHWVWLIEEFGPKFQYLPGPENVVADAWSRLDKAPSPSDDKEDTDKTHKPANCSATPAVDFLNPFREDDKLWKHTPGRLYVLILLDRTQFVQRMGHSHYML
jgi:hypothetical protein